MVDRWKVPDQIASEDPAAIGSEKDQNERESRSGHGSYLFATRQASERMKQNELPADGGEPQKIRRSGDQLARHSQLLEIQATTD